jgi:Uma2 family endonuclease
MTGGSRAHQRIVLNAINALIQALDPAAFDAVQEMRVQMPGGAVRYPDVAVVAGAIPPAARTLTDAVVICEVLSPDTAEADRGEKFAEYRTLPGLRAYVLIEQSSRAVTVWRLAAAGTWQQDGATPEMIALPEIGAVLTLAALYAGVHPAG